MHSFHFGHTGIKRSGSKTYRWRYRIIVKSSKGGHVVHRGKFKMRKSLDREARYYKKLGFYVKTYTV